MNIYRIMFIVLCMSLIQYASAQVDDAAQDVVSAGEQIGRTAVRAPITAAKGVLGFVSGATKEAEETIQEFNHERGRRSQLFPETSYQTEDVSQEAPTARIIKPVQQEVTQ